MEKRIAYVSRYSSPLTAEELEKLGTQAGEKNESLGVTGVLMASGGIFYQVLEGPSEVVDKLYATIEADERHTDLLLLRTEEPISHRHFGEWSMKVLNLDAASHVRLMPLKALIKAVFEQQRLVDNMVWAIERTARYELSGSPDG
jgi:hypothetical protein